MDVFENIFKCIVKKILLILRHHKQQIKTDLKYQGIIKALIRMGFSVDYSYIDGKNILIHHSRSEGDTLIGKCLSESRVITNIVLFRKISKFLKGKNYDFVFVRMMPTFHPFVEMMKEARRSSNKTIVEIPSYPLSGEEKSDKRKWRKIIYKVSEHYAEQSSKYVDLYAVIGDPCKKYLGRDAINICNGILTEGIPLKKNTSENKTEIHVLALAKMARWHGYDRLIEGLRIYKANGGNRKIFFHLVGNDGDGALALWKDLVDKYENNDMVIFEGEKYGADLDNMFNKCDIAVASLALHRKNATVTSELKIREYCARGIPFIYSADDAMLSPDMSFCKKVPLDDSPIDINMLIKFVDTVRNENNINIVMREFADSVMSWDGQIKKILDALS